MECEPNPFLSGQAHLCLLLSPPSQASSGHCNRLDQAIPDKRRADVATECASRSRAFPTVRVLLRSILRPPSGGQSLDPPHVTYQRFLPTIFASAKASALSSVAGLLLR